MKQLKSIQKRFFFRAHDEKILLALQKKLNLFTQAETVRFALKRLADAEGVKL